MSAGLVSGIILAGFGAGALVFDQVRAPPDSRALAGTGMMAPSSRALARSDYVVASCSRALARVYA
jgi:hypothetical protein